jgi:DNA repair protein RecO (recombination protein O)
VADLLLATGRTLDVITEAEIVDAHDTLNEDLDRGAAAGAVSELAERLSTDGDLEPRVYDLTVATLDAVVAAQPGQSALLVAAYYAKAMSMHGWRPQLGVCVACGTSTERGGYLSAGEGGMLCGSCAGQDPLAPAVSEPQQALLGELIGSTLADIVGTPRDPALVRSALLILRDFAVYHLGSRLRAIDFLLGLGE